MLVNCHPDGRHCAKSWETAKTILDPFNLKFMLKFLWNWRRVGKWEWDMGKNFLVGIPPSSWFYPTRVKIFQQLFYILSSIIKCIHQQSKLFFKLRIRNVDKIDSPAEDKKEFWVFLHERTKVKRQIPQESQTKINEFTSWSTWTCYFNKADKWVKEIKIFPL